MAAARPVLVVTDVQNGFVRKQSAHVVPIIVNLVQHWRGDIMFTRYLNYPGSPFERFFGWSRLQSAPETDIVRELEPFLGRGVVLDKTVYGPFTNEGEKLVKQHGWTE